MNCPCLYCGREVPTVRGVLVRHRRGLYRCPGSLMLVETIKRLTGWVKPPKKMNELQPGKIKGHHKQEYSNRVLPEDRCTRCPRRRVPGYKLCERHQEYARQKNREYALRDRLLAEAS
jgi:hypothetical protein